MDITALKKKFISLYGGNESSIRVFRAPGRVNLIGEHIDYNGGRVLPAALTMQNVVLVRPTAGSRIRLAADDLEDVMVECLYSNLESRKGDKWGSYQLGVADELLKVGYELPGCDMLFWGDVPYGAGLSSSASIEVATAVALATLSLEKQNKHVSLNMVDMALIGQRAENVFVGVACGIMDQFASAMGKKDHAVLLDCNTLEYEYIPLSLGDCKIVIANTRKKRALADSKYNERRAECESALSALRAEKPELKALCELTPEEYDRYEHRIQNHTVQKRARHAVEENARVTLSAELLKKGDLEGFGRQLNLSHTSLRDLYEVTGRELDVMAELAQNTPGCLGGRMTGAGFGGCTVNLVRSAAVEDFIRTVGPEYEKRTSLVPEFYVSGIANGAGELL